MVAGEGMHRDIGYWNEESIMWSGVDYISVC